MKKESEEKIKRLQLLEQGLQSFLIQKQTLQQQIMEMDNALEELKKSKGETYKISGPIMISVPREKLESDLKEKKEVIELRIKNLEKQENKIKDEAKGIQEEVMESVKNGKAK
jgi:prefoldin beta subunit